MLVNIPEIYDRVPMAINIMYAIYCHQLYGIVQIHKPYDVMKNPFEIETLTSLLLETKSHNDVIKLHNTVQTTLNYRVTKLLYIIGLH